MDYNIRKSNRAKNLSIRVNLKGECEVVIPYNKKITISQIQQIVKNYSAWIIKQQTKNKRGKIKQPLNYFGISKDKMIDMTTNLIEHNINYFRGLHPFVINSIKVREYRTRWGSCSNSKNLCFHYKLCLLPEELSKYIILHELCHTAHMNHSKLFWQLIESLCPNYRMLKKELKQFFV